MITEKQVNELEQKAKDDALNAFNDLLASYKNQAAQAKEIADNVDKYKKLLSEWAEKAHYRVDWHLLKASHFALVGECKHCHKFNVGLLKYNYDGYNVCEHCFDKLCDEFDDEYK